MTISGREHAEVKPLCLHLNEGAKTLIEAHRTANTAARLNDLAATKNAAAIEGIKAFIAIFKSKEDAEQAIEDSKKLSA